MGILIPKYFISNGLKHFSGFKSSWNWQPYWFIHSTSVIYILIVKAHCRNSCNQLALACRQEAWITFLLKLTACVDNEALIRSCTLFVSNTFPWDKRSIFQTCWAYMKMQLIAPTSPLDPMKNQLWNRLKSNIYPDVCKVLDPPFYLSM